MWVDGWAGVYAFMHEPPLKDLHNTYFVNKNRSIGNAFGNRSSSR